MGKMKNGKGKTRSVKNRVAVMATQQKRRKKTGANRSSSSGLLGQLGFGVGSLLGGPAGGLTGLAAGKLISRITGFGDYKVNRNSISNGNSVPTFGSAGKGMRVMHREFLTDITGSVSFLNRTYPINPGLITTFPWLSLIAADFEECDFEGLVFEYRPTSGTAVSSTSSALGVVILATDYDALNPSFTTKQQMESYEFATSTVPFAGCIHPVECARGANVLNSFYIRNGSPPPGADLRLYDLGNFEIATQGMQSAYIVGELWVSYDVVFKKPRLPKTITAPSYIRFRGFPTFSASTATPFGAGGTDVLENFLPGVTTVNNNVVLADPGYYLLNYAWRDGSAGNSRVAVTTYGVNVIAQPFLTGGLTIQTVLNGSASLCSVLCCVRVLSAGTGAANYVTTTFGADMVNNAFDLCVSRLTTPPVPESETKIASCRNQDEGDEHWVEMDLYEKYKASVSRPPCIQVPVSHCSCCLESLALESTRTSKSCV